MKKLMIGALAMGSIAAQAQEKLGILNIYSETMQTNAVQMGDMIRMEVDKLKRFEVLDKFELEYIAKKNNTEITNCYAKSCLEEKGKLFNAEFMLGGSITQSGDFLIVNFKLYNIKTEKLENSYIKEFKVPASQLKPIIELSIREMFGLEIDKELMRNLTSPPEFDNSITEPYAEKLNLNGPRMGYTFFTGEIGSILQASEKAGGFDVLPAMFQFGYQFETQYLNEGNFQGLFEFIPTITGMDQNLFIPSFSILNGMRNNRTGWEFAIGPTFSLNKIATGYTDELGFWRNEKDINFSNPNNIELETRLASDGVQKLTTSFVIAAGKSFRSGKLNIPINAYIVPSKKGLRFGASFGFNGKKNK